MSSPQETVEAAAAFLDSVGDGATRAAAALRAIDWTGPGPGEPPPPPPPPPPATTRASGYNPDNSAQGIDQAKPIGAWRGSPVTAYNVFEYGHKSRQLFVNSYSKPGWTPFRTVPILAHTGIMPILTIPGSVGDQKPDVSYADVAKGALDAEHEGNAAFIRASGPWKTDVALRIARECDTKGSWYYGDTPAERGAWAKAVAHLFNDIYAPVLPSAVLVPCVTKRADEAAWKQAVPFLDVPLGRLVLSIDAYLNKPSIDTPAGFKDNWLRLVEPKVDWAVAHGLQVAFSEWAITEVDQPGNLQRLLDFTEGLRKENRLHHEHYFGTGSRHQLYGQTPFPKSASAYAEWYKGH